MRASTIWMSLLALGAPSAALAQATFPTSVAGVRAGGQVMLLCDANAANCRPAGAGNAMATSRSTASIATAQVSVGTGATAVAAARAGRQRLTLTVGAANACYVGTATVTSATGFPLQPVAGASIVIETQGAVSAVCSATTTIGVLEEY